MDKDTRILRYVGFETFFETLKSDSLFLPVALTYESTDINEGRFTKEFVERMRSIKDFIDKERAVEGVNSAEEYRENLAAIQEFAQEDMNISLAWTMATREHAFVSCWTYRQEEDERMWRDFGDESKGVVICSTIRKVTNALENVMDPYKHEYHSDGLVLEGEFNLTEGEITYARQDIHKWLNKENFEDANLLPLFFLDAGAYEHEQEYRFVAYDNEEISEFAMDKLNEGEIAVDGNYTADLNYRKKKNSKPPRGLKVELALEELVTEVIIGSQMPPKNLEKIKQLMRKKGLSFPLLPSRLQVEEPVTR